VSRRRLTFLWAIIGSTSDARRAGKYAANAATTASTVIASAIEIASFFGTPEEKTCDESAGGKDARTPDRTSAPTRVRSGETLRRSW
jgi:hypothetical protein